MSKTTWIPAPLGVTGDLDAWVSYMDKEYPNPVIGNIYLMQYDNGQRVGYEFKGQHPNSGGNWWQRVKEEVVDHYFEDYLHSKVMNEESVMFGMTQALNPEIQEAMQALYDEGFDDEILADFAHQMRKR